MESNKNNPSFFSIRRSKIVPPPPTISLSSKGSTHHVNISSKLQEISKTLSAIQETSLSIKESLPFKFPIKEGEVIGVSRGLYEHYGVYVGNNRVIHYTSMDSDISLQNKIMETDMNDFLRDSLTFFILDCSNLTTAKKSLPISYQGFAFKEVFQHFQKHKLYSPEETVQRARSRLGEDSYSLLFNNCEHFAIWCKTGISKSHQVDAILKLITSIPIQL